MAENNNGPAQRPILDRLASGNAAAESDWWFEPDARGVIHPGEDFALAWLRYWRSLGHDMSQQGDFRGRWYTLVEILDPPFGPPDLPPHMRLFSREQHDGATRAMQVLLQSVPGARDAVSFLVSRGV